MNPNNSPELDKQILSSLERISEAFRVLLWEQSKSTGLSPIQIQFLIFISTQNAEKCRISYLAEEYNLTKATVSDSVKVLLHKGLLIKNTDPQDSRSFVLSLSLEGKAIVDRVSSFSNVFKDVLGMFSENEKQTFYSILHSLIRDLNNRGIISVQRNCSSCRFYSNQEGNHYCSLLNLQLMPYELRTDCAEHELKK